MDKKITYKLTVRLFTEEKCFGPGVAMLLHQVQELHSLRAAAASLSMAYSKAWTILKNAERLMNCKLLHSTAGGRNGGGASSRLRAQLPAGNCGTGVRPSRCSRRRSSLRDA